MAPIHVANMYSKVPAGMVAVDTTSRGGRWAGLSPFNLGPCPMYGGIIAENMENAWQFAKVYAEHADAQGNPTDVYWAWARRGWADMKAHRYPMGRGAVPLYSLWDGKRLSYIEARKIIYAPLYARAVQLTDSFQNLKTLAAGPDPIMLRDYDGYDYEKAGMTLTDVANEPRRKMGHAFVLKALLTQDAVLGEFAI